MQSAAIRTYSLSISKPPLHRQLITDLLAKLQTPEAKLLFVFIDIIERLLEWLKSIKDKAAVPADFVRNNVQWASFRPDPRDFTRPSGGDLPVVRRLKELDADERYNGPPKATGYIFYKRGGGYVYGPDTVSRVIWGVLFDEYSDEFKFYLEKKRK